MCYLLPRFVINTKTLMYARVNPRAFEMKKDSCVGIPSSGAIMGT